jgi:hypothetical protein
VYLLSHGDFTDCYFVFITIYFTSSLFLYIYIWILLFHSILFYVYFSHIIILPRNSKFSLPSLITYLLSHTFNTESNLTLVGLLRLTFIHWILFIPSSSLSSGKALYCLFIYSYSHFENRQPLHLCRGEAHCYAFGFYIFNYSWTFSDSKKLTCQVTMTSFVVHSTSNYYFLM